MCRENFKTAGSTRAIIELGRNGHTIHQYNEAYLFAAAPELLEVAMLVLTMQKAMKAEVERMPRSHQAPKTVDAIGILIAKANQAIAKAEGRTK